MIPARPPSFTDRQVHLAVVAAVVVLVSRMMFSLVIIPPWQQPDEPIHVSIAEVWRSRITREDASDRGRQAEIIASMIRHGWWRHYQQPPPSGRPTRFVSTGAVFSTIGLDPESPGYSPAYFAPAGWLLSVAPRGTVERDLYVMRIVSMLFGVATLWVAYLASRLALDDLGAATVTSLLAVQPQFALSSTTAGPDALVYLAGAIVWWQTMNALRKARPAQSLAIIWLVAIGAAIVDRLGVALIPIALLVTVIVSVTRLPRLRAVALLACAALVVAIAVSTIPAIRDQVRFSLRSPSGSPVLGDVAYIRRFAAFLFNSWWYSLGWVRYHAPQWWMIATAVLSIGASFGVLRQLLRRGPVRETVVVALLNLFALLAAVCVVFLRLRVGPQGRYLFPALVPLLTLLWLGTDAWVPRRRRKLAAAALIMTVAVLDLLAWFLVALPVYA